MLDYTKIKTVGKNDKPKTSCQKCLFKKSVNGIQTGCNFDNRIEKFIEKPEATVFKQKSDGEQYCLIDRLCTACVQKVPDGVDEYEFVRNSLRQQLSVILFVDELSSPTLEEVKDAYLSIIDQEVKPKKVVISYNSCIGVSAGELYTILKSEFNEYNVDTVVVKHLLAESWDDEFYDCVKKVDSPYFTFFSSNNKVPYNLASLVDNFVNDQMVEFVSIARPADAGSISGTIIMTNLFKRVIAGQKIENKFDVHDAIYDITHLKHGVLQWEM